jgi:outer membrane receptor protein involved in Fe transport
MKSHRIQLLAGAALSLSLIATPAFAQDEESANEIIVTAQRREQTLAEVPQSLSVITGAKLEQQQARSLMDFQSLVPGLNVTQTGPGEARIVLRGLNTGSVASAVAVYVDDVPFGSSGGLTGAAELVGDFDTFDIARIEVLRGPQGTLYGSNSLGGVVKYITAAPDTSKFEARAQVGIEDTAHGGIGWSGNAMINVPLGDKIAFRASGFYRERSGYIDSSATGAKDIDGLKSFGGRASLLFQPTETLSIRLSAIAQRLDSDANPYFTADPVTLRPFNARTGANERERTYYQLLPQSNQIDYRLYSGTIEWDAGFAKLTSVTSYGKQHRDKLSEVSIIPLRPTANLIYAPTAPNTIGIAIENDIDVKKFTQEVRLASADSDVFEWVVGGYYTDEDTLLFQRYVPFTIATQTLLPTAAVFAGRPITEFAVGTIAASYREIAGFATATLHLGDRFDITAGGRYSNNRQRSEQAVSQLGNSTQIFGKSSESVFTWSIAPRFELSDNVSVYARAAKGYRPGGPNFVPAVAPANFPVDYKADTVISYEAGIRAQTADRSFAIDAAAFYIDWDDIQIISTFTSASGTTGTNANGKRARSKGFEFNATARPTRGLTAIANITYTKAQLRDDTVPPAGGLNLTGGLAGDQLPFAPAWKVGLSADYDWAIGGDATAFIGGNVQWQSDQPAAFSAAYRAAFGHQVMLDGHATVDLRAGLTFGNYSLSAYVRNLTDSRAVITATSYPLSVPAAIGGTGRPFILAGSIQPRTMGATLGVKF